MKTPNNTEEYKEESKFYLKTHYKEIAKPLFIFQWEFHLLSAIVLVNLFKKHLFGTYYVQVLPGPGKVTTS